jgi:hypothetical protein
LGQYPASLHCPSAGHQNVTGTLKRVDQVSDGELTAVFNYSTCSGGLKIIKKGVLFEWAMDAKVANTIPMDIADSESLCFNVCKNDAFCKYSAWFSRTSKITGTGDCLGFHESDTLTNGTSWTKVCGISEQNCMTSGTGKKIFAKCDNFNSS